MSCVPGYEMIDDTCQRECENKTSSLNICIECLPGYRLANNKCVFIPNNNPGSNGYMQSKNPLCFNWQGNRCLVCLPGTFLSSRGICELVDPFCQQFDQVLETCRQCEGGYRLSNSKCIEIR